MKSIITSGVACQPDAKPENTLPTAILFAGNARNSLRQLTATTTRVKACLAVSVSILSSLSLNAGSITQAFEKYKVTHTDLECQSYLLKAAEQDVITQKKGYLPKVELEAKELAVTQDINGATPSVFKNGRSSYGNSRAKLELDQPLIDLTLKHKVGEANAAANFQRDLLHAKEDELIKNFVTSYLEAARITQLESSVDRIITRLDKEQSRVSASLKEKMSTVDDVENIKSAYVAMQQEKRMMEEQRQRLLAELGFGTNASVDLPIAKNDLPKLPLPVASQKGRNPKIDAIKSQLEALNCRIAGTGNKDMPRLSLYGLAQYDDAGGSQFGTARTLNDLEAGVMLKWNCFDSGINQSEVKKLGYLKKAKEAELAGAIAQAKRESEFDKQGLKLSESNLRSLDKLVAQQNSIMKAAELSYQNGGEKNYIQMVNSFLSYEAQVRQQIHGKFDYIQKQAEVYAAGTGWNHGLIEDMDRLFAGTH